MFHLFVSVNFIHTYSFQIMKTIFASVIGLFALVTFTSCEVCTTCTYTFTDASGETVESPQPEFCGSRSEVKDLEEAADDAAKTVSAAVGGTNASASCVRD